MAKTFRTPKGTELPLLNLKGKDYLQVAHRLVWFREEHPNLPIRTEILTPLDAPFAVAKAEIFKEDGTSWATAHKKEEVKHFPDFMEKAETGAIGRALASCGYGTQFAPELDESERIVDSPLPAVGSTPAAKSATTQHIQPGFKKMPPDFGDYVPKFGKFEGQPLKTLKPDELRSYCRWLVDDSKKKGKPISSPTKDFLDAAQFFLENSRDKQRSLLQPLPAPPGPYGENDHPLDDIPF